MKFDLPLPPSMNHYWRALGRGRVVVSEDGRAYRKAVWALVRQKPLTKLAGRLHMTVAVTFPNNVKSDIDNRLKPLLDSLQHAGVYEDDSQIDDLRIYRVGVEKPGGVVVTVGVIETAPPRYALDHCS